MLTSAVGFVADYWGCKHPILSPWRQRDGWWVAWVCDWEKCWSGDAPALASIVATRDFTPQHNETLEHTLAIAASLKLDT